jgi:enoyl-CoA hydratase/carnithine racemase
MDMDVFSALEYEARVQAHLMTRPDFQEGYRAFVEKRRPRFDGSPE